LVLEVQKVKEEVKEYDMEVVDITYMIEHEID
jgi:hypothetical protein